jgi:ferredoxin-NADP reductase
VSGWLHDTLRPGMQLNVLGPSGEFTYVRHASTPYLFLSAAVASPR